MSKQPHHKEEKEGTLYDGRYPGMAEPDCLLSLSDDADALCNTGYGIKAVCPFFLGILFILVVLEPFEKIFGGETFLISFEQNSRKGLQQIYESGREGLEDTLESWNEENYQKELQEKIEEIYAAYHIPQQETHNNNQITGVDDGEIGINR